MALREEGGALKPALPREVIDLPRPLWNEGFKVSPDGERVLGIKSTTTTSERNEPVVVVNWVDKLEAKVPAAR